jgi:hypothetical protein
MNINANVATASANWERLFSEIHENAYRNGVVEVELTDSEADRYDFANEILMGRMQERLLETLEKITRAVPFSYLTFGNKIFMTMNERQQQTFFHSIFNLPVTHIDVGVTTDNGTESPAITISTSALLETLPQLQTSVKCFFVRNFALTHQSDVQSLSNIIVSKRATLLYLWLENIECPVDGCNKEASDGSDRFLDPLLYATFGLYDFCVSTKTRSVHSTLVSPTALRALFVEGKQFQRLSLNGLGLTDSHVLAIEDGLSTPGTHLRMLDLESNPGITAQGYDALLNLINRANVLGYGAFNKWHGFRVDDKVWEGNLNLLSEMNWKYSRLEYLTNGTFTSAERRWQWLERAVGLSGSNAVDEDERKKSDAKHLNFVWYTLCENPEMMQTY